MRILVSTIILAASAALASATTPQGTPVNTAPGTGTQNYYISPDAITAPQQTTGNAGFTVDAVYLGNTDSEGMDYYGSRLSLDFYSAPVNNLQSQFSISVGYYYGSESSEGMIEQTTYTPAQSYRYYSYLTGRYETVTRPAKYETDYVEGTVKTETMMIPVTFAYALNINLSDNVVFFPSFKVGYTYGETSYSGDDSTSDFNGFQWAIGFGFKVKLSPSVFVQTAVEYNSLHVEDATDTLDTLNVSMGLGWKF